MTVLALHTLLNATEAQTTAWVGASSFASGMILSYLMSGESTNTFRREEPSFQLPLAEDEHDHGIDLLAVLISAMLRSFKPKEILLS